EKEAAVPKKPRPMEPNRGKQQTAIPPRIIPVAAAVGVAVGRPIIAGRIPDKPGPIVAPISRLPSVIVIRVKPVARNVESIIRGRRRTRTVIQRFRGLRKIGNFVLFVRCPVAGRPLPAVLRLDPGAGNPMTVERRHAPEPAYPDEIVPIRIPSPVAFDPLHV